MISENKISVLGAGTMGAGMAATYAIYGYDTALYSRTQQTLDRAALTIADMLRLFSREDMLLGQQPSDVLKRIHYTDDIERAVGDAWYVAETVVERPDVKSELYRRLDGLLPEGVVISSNTSYMNIFELMPDRRQNHTAIVHWVAPPHIIPLVEIIKGPQTGERTMQAMMELHEHCGKTPIRMEKFVNGFVLNRLQSAMTREVLFLMQGGYCSAEMIDLVAKTSLMPRGLLLGVVQRMDFNGLDMVADGLKNKSYQPAPAPSGDNPIFGLCGSGDLGVKTGKGFYDYSGMTREEAQTMRDEQLMLSVKLARQFLSDPIGKPRDK